MDESVMQLQTNLGNAIVSELAEYDWEKITVFYAEVGDVSQAQCDYVDSRGQLQHASLPDEALDMLEELKSAFASPGKGTWLSADLLIDRATAEFKIKFNYNDKPKWHIEPEPENYLLDLERYPRPEAEIPAWYPKAEDYPDWHKELER